MSNLVHSLQPSTRADWPKPSGKVETPAEFAEEGDESEDDALLGSERDEEAPDPELSKDGKGPERPVEEAEARRGGTPGG